MCVLSMLRDLWHEGSGREADTARGITCVVYCDITVTKQ